MSEAKLSEVFSELEAYLEDELDIGEVDRDGDLLDQGMDSMMLIEIQSRLDARGIDVEYGDLAETPTVSAWEKLIAQAL
ncbi:phosphopantetheine-binding protein [Corynebacterium frankenforstense]